MEGCSGCFQAQKAIDQETVNVREAAKKFAIANKTAVYIYYDEFAQPQFMAEGKARALGIQPMGGIFSPFEPMY